MTVEQHRSPFPPGDQGLGPGRLLTAFHHDPPHAAPVVDLLVPLGHDRDKPGVDKVGNILFHDSKGVELGQDLREVGLVNLEDGDPGAVGEKWGQRTILFL